MARMVCLPEEKVRAYHLGELSEDEADAVAAHLEVCADCEALAARLDEVSDPVVAALRQHPPAHSAFAHASHVADTPRLGPCLTALLPAQKLPRFFAGYEILEELGRGGMGVVYRARQLALNRVVALKMVLTGARAAPTELVRFMVEAEMVGRLAHPHIVQIHEVGQHEGMPFLALECVEGGTLAARLRGKRWPARKAAALVEQLARAVQHAHQHGVVHRDLKPANVLLAEDGTPKITDFGLAKPVQGATGLTSTGAIVGTPAYMAPEQARGGTVGPAADTYGLGVLLYEMLAGRTPFDAETPLELLSQVTGQEVPPLSRFQPGLPRDLSTICLRCLEKEPGRRYATAGALADDLQRFLNGEPIQARPVGDLERLAKWARRRPAVAGLLAAVFLVAALGFALVAWQWNRAEGKAAAEALARHDAEQKERQEEAARREVERLTASILLDQGSSFGAKGDVARGLLSFARGLEFAIQAGDADLERVARVNLASWRGQFVRPAGQLVHKNFVVAVAFSPDGKTAVTGCLDKFARRLDVATGKLVGEPLPHTYEVLAVAFSRDGKTLLTGGGPEDNSKGEVRLWDAVTGKPIGQPLTQPAAVQAVAFSPDRGGSKFLTVCSTQAQLWDTKTRERIGEPLRHRGGVTAAAFSPDGKLLLTAGADGLARLWETSADLLQEGSLKEKGKGLRHEGPITSLAFSPDGGLILTGSADASARLWETSTGKAQGLPLKHRGPVQAVTFSTDGQTLATGGVVVGIDLEKKTLTEEAGEVRLWRVTGELIGQPLPHPKPVLAVAISPDGRLVLTGCLDGRARFFWTTSGGLVGRPLEHQGLVRALAFSPDGKTALTASGAGWLANWNAYLWELPPARDVARSLHQEPLKAGRPGADVACLAFSPDGKLLLVGTKGKGVHLWDVARRQPVGEPLQHEGHVTYVGCSPDGNTLLTAGKDRVARLWERSSGRLLRECQLGDFNSQAAFSPDGRTFLTATRDGGVQAWETATGKSLGNRLPPVVGLPPVTLAADGRIVLRGGEDARGVQVWDLTSGKVLHTWQRSREGDAGTFSPDGRSILTASEAYVQIRETATGRPLGISLPHNTLGLPSRAWHPDGRTVATGGWDQAARLWDVTTGKPLGAPLLHPQAPGATAFAPGGRLLATSTAAEVYLWPVPAPLAGDAEQMWLWVEVLTGMEVDARGGIQELEPDALEQRRQRLKQLGRAPGDGK